MYQGPKFLTAEQFLLTTLIVKLAVMAVLATMVARYQRFRHILIFERRGWQDRLVFALAIGIPLMAGVTARLLLGYNAADLTLEHGLFFGIRAAVPPPSAGVYLSPFGALHAAAQAVPASPLAPGTAYSLYGSNLAAVTRAASAADLPSNLAGVRVLIDGTPAGLFSISPSQINLRAPDSLTAPVATLQVDNNGSLSNLIEVPVASTAPGVFSVAQNGAGAALVTHADFSLVTATAPARPGETVIVYAAGLGSVAPVPGSGLSVVTDPGLRVLFDGVAGEIAFAGMVPGFVGLYQINVLVPAVASAAPVNLAVVTSNAVSDLAEVTVR